MEYAGSNGNMSRSEYERYQFEQYQEHQRQLQYQQQQVQQQNLRPPVQDPRFQQEYQPRRHEPALFTPVAPRESSFFGNYEQVVTTRNTSDDEVKPKEKKKSRDKKDKKHSKRSKGKGKKRKVKKHSRRDEEKDEQKETPNAKGVPGDMKARPSPVPTTGLIQLDNAHLAPVQPSDYLRRERERLDQQLENEMSPVQPGDMDIVYDTVGPSSEAVLQSYNSRREREDAILDSSDLGVPPPGTIHCGHDSSQNMPAGPSIADLSAWRRDELEELAETQYEVKEGVV